MGVGTRLSVDEPDTRQILPGVFGVYAQMIARSQTRMSARVDRCATLQMPTNSQHWEYRLTIGNRVFLGLFANASLLKFRKPTTVVGEVFFPLRCTAPLELVP